MREITLIDCSAEHIHAGEEPVAADFVCVNIFGRDQGARGAT